MKTKFWQFSLIIIIFPFQLAFSQEINIQTKPSWVVDVSAPEVSQVSKYDVQGGVYYRLVDHQTNLKEESTYFHHSQKIVSSGGVTSTSQLQITYDSAYQSVILHEVKVHRNDQILDKSTQLKFEYIKNEQELKSNIYTGYVTALAVIEDLRKNDILEVSYTIIGNNPVYDGADYHLFPVQDINQIDRAYIRAIYPSDMDYVYRCEGCEEEQLKVSQSGSNSILVFDKTNLNAVELENTMPSWIIPYDYLELSSTNSWRQVNDWALDIFKQSDDDNVDQVLKETFSKGYSQEDKINAVINFVQDEIRYMGIESGLGNIKPFSPNQTLKQRFGDCKDKSLLLVTMLRRIGVDNSYVALVNSAMQHNISQLLPSGHAFDHCIVFFRYQEKDYWVDPTNSFQGGAFQEMVPYNYGKALIVSEETEGLTDIKVQSNVRRSFVKEHFNISSFDSSATVKVNSEMYGARADYTRQILEYYSKKELAEAYKYPMGLLYPALIESQDLKIEDDEHKNIVKTEENYSIPGVWLEDLEGHRGKWVFNYEPVGLSNYIFQLSCERKGFPVYIDYPITYEQSTTFDLPEVIIIDTAAVRFDNAAFSFEKTTRLIDPYTLQIDYSFTTKTKEVSSEEFVKVCQDMNQIVYGINVSFEYPKVSAANSSALNYTRNNSFTFSNDENNLYSYISWKNNLSNTTGTDPTVAFSYAKLKELESMAEEQESNDISVRVDEQPYYPGGMKAFYKYIKKNMKYPDQARRLKLKGKVFVSFVVTKSGELSSVRAVQGIGAGCDEEAVRLVESAGKWKPGKLEGEPVEVRMMLPITF